MFRTLDVAYELFFLFCTSFEQQKNSEVVDVKFFCFFCSPSLSKRRFCDYCGKHVWHRVFLFASLALLNPLVLVPEKMFFGPIILTPRNPATSLGGGAIFVSFQSCVSELLKSGGFCQPAEVAHKLFLCFCTSFAQQLQKFLCIVA